MKFENTEVWGFRHAFRGMRNPKNSWSKSDSDLSDGCHVPEWIKCEECKFFAGYDKECIPNIGENDLKLAQTLITGGSEHRKFLRQIFISVDITAPLYWWKEFDTYKIGTVANSTSTMHKLATTPITLECFEIDDFQPEFAEFDYDGFNPQRIVAYCEKLRKAYLKTNNKKYWKELIRWLPESWLQKRTVTMDYENVYSIVRQRYFHKLNEWSGQDEPAYDNFISWAHTLPCANDLIFYGLDDAKD